MPQIIKRRKRPEPNLYPVIVELKDTSVSVRASLKHRSALVRQPFEKPINPYSLERPPFSIKVQIPPETYTLEIKNTEPVPEIEGTRTRIKRDFLGVVEDYEIVSGEWEERITSVAHIALPSLVVPDHLHVLGMFLQEGRPEEFFFKQEQEGAKHRLVVTPTIPLYHEAMTLVAQETVCALFGLIRVDHATYKI